MHDHQINMSSTDAWMPPFPFRFQKVWPIEFNVSEMGGFIPIAVYPMVSLVWNAFGKK